MFGLFLASALLGSGDFAADIRNAEDFIQLKAEVTQLKAEVAELKARCKCSATQSAGPIDIGGNPVTFNFDLPPSTTSRTVCSGGKCSTTYEPASRMIVHSTPVQVSSYGVVSGGCSASSCSQTFGVPTQTFGVEQQSFGIRHFKQRTKCKGCN